MYFYRTPQTQWVWVRVETGGESAEFTVGLKGGVLTASPDDPILPHDWVNGMGWGGARNRNVTPEFREKAEGTAITMKRMGFLASRIHLPVEDYRNGDEEVMAEFDRRIDMQLRHGFCVAIHGNDYSRYMMEPSYGGEAAATMRAAWDAVAKRFKNRSHRVALAFFVELKNETNLDTLRATHEDLTARLRVITPTRLIVYQGKSRDEPEAFPVFDGYVPGLGSPYYVYSFHKGFGGAKNSWYRSDQDRDLSMVRLAGDYVNKGDTAVFMDVYNHENTQAGPEPYAHRVKHVKEMWELLMSGRHIHSIFIVDRQTEKIVWAWGPGEILGQHEPTMLEDGNILLFDNGHGNGRSGDGGDRPYSRVVAIEPATGKIVWEYVTDPPEEFVSYVASGNQRLPNGNTFVCAANWQGAIGRLFEVTPEGEIVWEYWNPDRKRYYRAQRHPAESVERLLEENGRSRATPGGTQD